MEILALRRVCFHILYKKRPSSSCTRHTQIYSHVDLTVCSALYHYWQTANQMKQKKKGRTSEIETPRVFNIVCSLSKDWRKSSQKKNSIDNNVSVRPSVRDPMVKQTWTSYLYIYSQIHPENRLPIYVFFFKYVQ